MYIGDEPKCCGCNPTKKEYDVDKMSIEELKKQIDIKNALLDEVYAKNNEIRATRDILRNALCKAYHDSIILNNIKLEGLCYVIKSESCTTYVKLISINKIEGDTIIANIVEINKNKVDCISIQYGIGYLSYQTIIENQCSTEEFDKAFSETIREIREKATSSKTEERFSGAMDLIQRMDNLQH